MLQSIRHHLRSKTTAQGLTRGMLGGCPGGPEVRFFVTPRDRWVEQHTCIAPRSLSAEVRCPCTVSEVDCGRGEGRLPGDASVPVTRVTAQPRTRLSGAHSTRE